MPLRGRHGFVRPFGCGQDDAFENDRRNAPPGKRTHRGWRFYAVRCAKGINLPPEKRCIGYVFQDARLFAYMSVKRNLTYARWAGHRQATRSFDEVVALLGIGHLLDRRPRHFPAASASVSPLAARFCPIPHFCCSMSHYPRSIMRGGRKYCPSLSGFATKAMCRSSM